MKTLRVSSVLLLLLIMFSCGLQAQNNAAERGVIVQSSTKIANKTAASLVQQYLVGPNIELIIDSLHKVTFNELEVILGTYQNISTFYNTDTTGCHMPMDTGIVIATGLAIEAGAETCGSVGSESPQKAITYSPKKDPDGTSPYRDFYYTYYKYAEENSYPKSGMSDIGYLTFWIKPKINNFAFTYCFASKEYPSQVNSSKSDFFGFYFSGPYDSLGQQITGTTLYEMQNIALVPGTNTPVMINTVNHGTAKSPESEHDLSVASYPEYHKINCDLQACRMNEYTTKLSTTLVNVLADYYYRIDIGIADIGDNGITSAVYISKDLRRFDTIYIDTAICDNQVYYFEELDQELYETGVYKYTTQNETGGDVYKIFNLTVYPTDYVSQCWTLRAGETLEMNGIVIDKPGRYITSLETDFGCDSTVVFDVYEGSTTGIVNCDSVMQYQPINDTTNDSGIDEIDLAEQIKVYPNPADNAVYVTGLSHGATAVIFDNNGKIVKEIDVLPDGEIDISDLASGIYYINIRYDNLNIRKRLMKQ